MLINKICILTFITVLFTMGANWYNPNVCQQVNGQTDPYNGMRVCVRVCVRRSVEVILNAMEEDVSSVRDF